MYELSATSVITSMRGLFEKKQVVMKFGLPAIPSAQHLFASRCVIAAFCLASVVQIGAQTPGASPATGSWAGWARCQIDVQGQGYSDQQIHTWTMTGTPTVEGAFRVYPGTWSVVGSGAVQRTQGTQTLNAQWATNVASMPAPMAVFVRASDGRMFVQSRHAQLRSAGAVAGYQQLTIDGKPQTPGKIGSEAFEWAFPLVEVDSKGKTISASSTPIVNGSVGYMQPAGSHGTASCTWQFGQGAAAPAPPSTLAARPVPTPPAAVAGATVGAGATREPVARLR